MIGFIMLISIGFFFIFYVIFYFLNGFESIWSMEFYDGFFLIKIVF